MKIVTHWPKKPVMWVIEQNHCPVCGQWGATCDGKRIKCLSCGHQANGVSWSESFPSGPKSKRTLYVSVPFTWNMPAVKRLVCSKNMFWTHSVIGGPGAYLCLHYYPDFLQGIPNVEVRDFYPGVLQRVNPQATRTTTGCIRQCRFCGIGMGIIEPGGFRPLDEWLDRPVLTDNNLLAAPLGHFDRVIDRLKKWEWCDFEQGLDPRLLTDYHAQRIAEIANPIVRLSLDSSDLHVQGTWVTAFEALRRAGITKHQIRSYVLIGFDTGPEEAWERCRWVENYGVKALPMWYHRLDTLKHNIVTQEQAALGWTDYERRRICQFFYWHKEAIA
jgi:hypothetical protein